MKWPWKKETEKPKERIITYWLPDPKKDITAYEVMRILGKTWLFNDSKQVEGSWISTLPPELQRHFKKCELKEKSK